MKNGSAKKSVLTLINKNVDNLFVRKKNVSRNMKYVNHWWCHKSKNYKLLFPLCIRDEIHKCIYDKSVQYLLTHSFFTILIDPKPYNWND